MKNECVEKLKKKLVKRKDDLLEKLHNINLTERSYQKLCDEIEECFLDCFDDIDSCCEES